VHSLSRRLIRAQHATCSVETKVCTSSVYAGQSVLCMTLSSSSTTRVQEFCGVDPLPRRFQGSGRGTYIPKLHLVTLSALGAGRGKGKGVEMPGNAASLAGNWSFSVSAKTSAGRQYEAINRFSLRAQHYCGQCAAQPACRSYYTGWSKNHSLTNYPLTSY